MRYEMGLESIRARYVAGACLRCAARHQSATVGIKGQAPLRNWQGKAHMLR
jgi:hypothetical protein